MASHAIGWLSRRQMVARTVTLKVRYADFTTITRSHTARGERARKTGLTRARRFQLLDRTDAGPAPRSACLGVSVHNFCSHADETPEGLATVRRRLTCGCHAPRGRGSSVVERNARQVLGSRHAERARATAVLRKIFPISIHGQASWENRLHSSRRSGRAVERREGRT